MKLEKSARRLSRDFRAYIPEAWKVIEPDNPFVPGWHIDAVAEHLTAISRGQIRKLIINIPPGHMKSLEACVFWQTWEWTDRPELRFIFASHDQSLATRDSLKCRRIIESDWYQMRWGDRVQLAADENLKTRFQNTRAGFRYSFGVGGATGERADRIVVDDPHKIEEVLSSVTRKSVLDWWDTTMWNRVTDPEKSGRVVVMQRLHQQDLTGHLLASGDWEHLCLPAEYEPGKSKRATSIGWNDPRTKPAELLWPERFGAAAIVEAKSHGSYNYAGQYQQSPSPAEGGMLKRAWWQEYGAIPAELDTLIQSWDLTFKDGAANDFVVGQVWGKKGGNVYLLDQVRARLDFPATKRAIASLSKKWPAALTKLIEDKANGPAIIAEMKADVTGIIAVKVKDSKEERAAAVSPSIESGNVFLPSPDLAPWIHDFLEEASVFPMGAHDDQVDAMTQALARLLGKKGRGWDLAAYAETAKPKIAESAA